MDTVARYPLTAFMSVAIFFAISLQVGIPQQTEPAPPPSPPTLETGVPGITRESVGLRVSITGRFNEMGPLPDRMMLMVNHCQVTCMLVDAEAISIPRLRGSDEVTVEGRVTAIGVGYVHLADCKLVHPRPKR